MKSRLEQLEIEIAFEKGAKIESVCIGHENWSINYNPIWSWDIYDYRISEEPKRIPFDGSDAFNLLGQKFKLIESPFFYSICTDVDERGVYFGEYYFIYERLVEEYEKWNDLLKEWQPCNKVA